MREKEYKKRMRRMKIANNFKRTNKHKRKTNLQIQNELVQSILKKNITQCCDRKKEKQHKFARILAHRLNGLSHYQILYEQTLTHIVEENKNVY